MNAKITETAWFWNAYTPPASHVAALVQMPAYRINAEALATAYVKDWRDARRAALEASDA